MQEGGYKCVRSPGLQRPSLQRDIFAQTCSSGNEWNSKNKTKRRIPLEEFGRMSNERSVASGS